MDGVMMKITQVCNQTILLYMTTIALCIVTWPIAMATERVGCQEDLEQILKYAKLEPPTIPYSEPLVPTAKATFGMGCFWGVEASFGARRGVVRVKAGYTGGTLENPNYRNLGDHTEAVEIEFDPTKTNFGELLRVFWSDHYPTGLEKPQYMSAIYYHDEVQRHLAASALKAEQKRIGEFPEIVTKLLPAGTFYDAEDYHQKYFLRQQAPLVQSLDLKDADFLSSSRTTRLLGYMSGSGTEEAFNDEIDSLALSPSQAEYVRILIRSKDGGTCH